MPAKLIRLSCKNCKSDFISRHSTTQHCSRECFRQTQRTPIAIRFARHVDRSVPAGCWLWTANKSPDGYGQFGISPGEFGDKRVIVHAHRVAWMLVHGPIPDGKHVLHTCDVRHCCNDSHLWLGTNAENCADRKQKGRNGDHRGENNGRAKLSHLDVSTIKSSPEGATILAARYGVNRSTISGIRSGRKWACSSARPSAGANWREKDLRNAQKSP